MAPLTVFKGTPTVKISEGGNEHLPEVVSRDAAANLAVVISKIGDNFYWASRDNTPLGEIERGGAYITYVALNGSGYIRVIKPSLKGAARLTSDTEAEFDYVEHVLIGLRSVTYYGTRTAF